MKGLVYQEVVTRALTDDSEIVDERVRKLPVHKRPAERLLRYAGTLVLVTRRESSAGYSLRLVVNLDLEVVVVDGRME